MTKEIKEQKALKVLQEETGHKDHLGQEVFKEIKENLELKDEMEIKVNQGSLALQEMYQYQKLV